jgi:uncharacterized repeat protein (TIGR01451 family)
VQQADINNNGGGDGDIDNKATVSTTEPGVDDKFDEELVGITRTPDYAIDKTVVSVDPGTNTDPFTNGNGIIDADGDIINYKVVVTNTGNVDLGGIALVDTLVAVVGTEVESLTDDDILEVGETWTWTYSYTVQQADINNNGGGDGDIDNKATVSTTEPGVDDKFDEELVMVVQAPDHDLTKTFDPNPVGAGETGTFTLVYTNTGNVTLNNISITDTVKPILDVQSVEFTVGDGNCDNVDLDDNDQTITCSVDTLAPGDSVTVTVTFVAAPLADELVPDTGQTSGANYVFYFENGYVLYGSTGDGYATLVDPDGKEATADVEGRNQDIFFNTPVGGGPDGGFALHLSCSEVFINGWGDNGPIEGEDDGWRILAYEVLRFNTNGMFKDCGQIFAPFEVLNEAEAEATPAGGTIPDDPVTGADRNPIKASDTLELINPAPIVTARERVRKGDVEIQYFNTSYEEVEIDMMRIEWDDPSVLLESAIFQFRAGDDDIGLSGCGVTLEGTCLLQDETNTILPARSKDWLKLSFDPGGAPTGLTITIVTDNGSTLIHEFGVP